MRVYAQTRIAEVDQQLFAHIADVLHRFNDDPISCHTLARAVVQCVPSLTLVDGHVRAGGYRFNHSWTITGGGNIIDVYPIAAIGGPFLMATLDSPWSIIYLPSRPNWWDDEVEKADVRHLATVLKSLGLGKEI
jgi:hypothetical protein